MLTQQVAASLPGCAANKVTLHDKELLTGVPMQLNFDNDDPSGKKSTTLLPWACSYAWLCWVENLAWAEVQPL